MAIKWQDAGKITGGISVSVFVAIMLVLNMSGMSFIIPSDQVCVDCYDIIQVNSSIWEIKVEHAGPDKPLLFAKRMRSRTRWINLDKVDELIQTDPPVFVEILVPTVKRYSTINHPIYGYLRPIKDGDSLIKRKSIKYNPKGSRFIVRGITNGQRVKWGFNLDSLVMDGVVFDPVWNPESGSFSVRETCVNVTRSILKSNMTTIINDCDGNASCVPEYNVTNFYNVEEVVEVCEESAVRFGNRTVMYEQDDKACLRTGSTLCCWLREDGGLNLKERADEYRDVIRSGESGSCVDISKDFEVKYSRSDFKEVLI